MMENSWAQTKNRIPNTWNKYIRLSMLVPFKNQAHYMFLRLRSTSLFHSSVRYSRDERLQNIELFQTPRR